MLKTTIDLSNSEIKRINLIAEYLGLKSRIAVINYLTKECERKIKREARKNA